MLKPITLACALATLCLSAAAQQPPSSGTQLQQIAPPPAPDRAAASISISPADPATAPLAAQATLRVSALRLRGARLFAESDLLAITGFQPDSVLTLDDLNAMARRITAFYRQKGYVLARAFVPAQDIRDGVVGISVVEGELARVTVRNQSTLADSLIDSQLDGIATGRPAELAALDSGLLRLSDVPGVSVSSTLVPGAAPGSSDLVVDVLPTRTVTGNVDVDNAGNRYTGEWRLGATVNLNNLAGRGDVASLRAVTSGSGLNYARAAYQMQVGKGTVGVAYSGLKYELGREFAPLRAHGTATVTSLYGSYPLIRSRDTNLYAQASLDGKTFQDKIDATASVVDKRSHVLVLGLRGDHRDSLGGGGVSSYALNASVGQLDIETPGARAFDAATAQSNGHFTKVGFSAARLQSLTSTLSLYGAIGGQAASRNLDASEKMQLGGSYGVRAYPQGEAFGDEGYLATLEARLLLTQFADRLPGQLQLVGFIDTGSVKVNHSPWAGGDNRRTLSGAGVGLNWSVYADFTVRAFYARKLGSAPALSAPDASGRFWLQAVKYF